MKNDFVKYVKLIEPNSCVFSSALYEIPHIHGDYEIILCKSGCARLQLGNDEYILSSGKGVFILPNIPHKYTNISSGEFCAIVFKPEIIPILNKNLISKHLLTSVFIFEDCDDILNLVNHMKVNYIPLEDSFEMQFSGYVNFLMYLIYPKLSFSKMSQSANDVYEKVKAYCNENFRENISLEIIAKKIYSNPNHISKIFNEVMGMSISQYIRFLRVSEVYNLIITTDYTISKISHDVGFGTIRSMNRAFFDLFGTTPSEVRKYNKRRD